MHTGSREHGREGSLHMVQCGVARLMHKGDRDETRVASSFWGKKGSVITGNTYKAREQEIGWIRVWAGQLLKQPFLPHRTRMPVQVAELVLGQNENELL